MIKNPFYEPILEIKRRKNPMGEYAHLNTKELLDAVRQSILPQENQTTFCKV
ncbi:MAG: hypothetical protein L3J10_06630 [Sulfurimonas sp.]|nr:hypothetical protein [Sulfurimonas sp.]